MIPESVAMSQIKRLKIYPKFKDLDTEAKIDYSRMFASACQTPYQAAQAMDTWIRTQKFLPAPAELIELVSECNAAPVERFGDCLECMGRGRRTFWALITTERWPDSGRIKRRIVEEIPPEGDQNYWLMTWPSVASKVNPDTQTVSQLCGYCLCEYGQRLKELQLSRRGEE